MSPRALSGRYLGEVISECDRTANQNGEVFKMLKTYLFESVFIVRTAGAQRSGTDFLEVLELVDQAKPNQEAKKKSDVPLRSEQAIVNVETRLPKDDNQIRNRVLHVLDAVVREKGDLSKDRLTKWLSRSALKGTVASNNQEFPALSTYLNPAKNTQGSWNPTQIAQELARLWKPSRRGESFFPGLDRVEIQSTITDLSTTAQGWKSKDARVDKCAEAIFSFLERRRQSQSTCPDQGKPSLQPTMQNRREPTPSTDDELRPVPRG